MTDHLYATPETPDRRCGTCRFWNRDLYPSRDPIWTECIVPLPPMPFWMSENQRVTRETEGTNCPAWASREEAHGQ